MLIRRAIWRHFPTFGSDIFLDFRFHYSSRTSEDGSDWELDFPDGHPVQWTRWRIGFCAPSTVRFDSLGMATILGMAWVVVFPVSNATAEMAWLGAHSDSCKLDLTPAAAKIFCFAGKLGHSNPAVMSPFAHARTQRMHAPVSHMGKDSEKDLPLAHGDGHSLEGAEGP